MKALFVEDQRILHLCSRQHFARSPRISPDVRVVISKQSAVNLGQYDVTDVATNELGQRQWRHFDLLFLWMNDPIQRLLERKSATNYLLIFPLWVKNRWLKVTDELHEVIWVNGKHFCIIFGMNEQMFFFMNGMQRPAVFCGLGWSLVSCGQRILITPL